MDKFVIGFIGVFFVIGGIDYLLGCPLRLGNKFEDGFKTMGALGLGIMGIYSLSPVLLKILLPLALNISNLLHIDPSIIPASIFATDMGGYQLCTNIAINKEIGKFSAVIIASTLGSTISFTIPIACSLVKADDQEYFAKGIMLGIITLPVGWLAAGLWSGLNIVTLILNMMPISIFAVILSICLIKLPDKTIKGFKYFGKFITGLSIVGIILLGINVIFQIKLVDSLIPFEENMMLVGKITFILAGAYPMLELLTRVLKNFFRRLGRLLGVNSVAVGAMIGNLASNLLVFGNLHEMNPKGKVVCTALGVSGAFVFGGQLAYIASVAPDMIGSYFITKFVSGILSLSLVSIVFQEKYSSTYRVNEIEIAGE